MFLGTVEDLFSRRLLDLALSDRHPTAELAEAAIHMAVAARGGDIAGVIFHSDKDPSIPREPSPRPVPGSGSASSWDGPAALWDNASGRAWANTTTGG